MAVSSDPYANAWQTTRLAISSALDVKTFSATDDALYILAADGSLLTSADGLSWTSTGTVWKILSEDSAVSCSASLLPALQIRL